MAVEEVFIDLTRKTGGSGTPQDPLGDIFQINWRNNLRLRFRRGKIHKLPSRYGGVDVPASVTGGIEITDYGSASERATLDGSVVYKNWTRYSGNIWYVSGIPKGIGVVLEDDVPLDWVDGSVSSSVFLPKMVPGTYAYDLNGTVYVRLRDNGNPNAPGNRVAISRTIIGIAASRSLTDLQVNNLRIVGCARQGSNIRRVRNAEFINNFVQYCGGAWDYSRNYHVGGGLQCTGGCRNILYERNTCIDVFDSPISPQTPDNNGVIDNVIIRRNVLGNFALAGVEVANWAENTVIRNVLIEDNHIFGGGRGWSGTGGQKANTEGVIINGRPKHRNIRIIGNVIQDIYHAGVKIQDADADGIEIKRNQISDCTYGVRNFAGENVFQRVFVSHNEIRNCSIAGIYHSQRLGNAVSQYRKNTLINNGTVNLAVFKLEAGVPVVKDNNIFGASIGIQKTGSRPFDPQFNNVFGATSANFRGINKGATNSSVNPLFQDPGKDDFQLRPNSPLVDGGSGSSPGKDLIGQTYATDDIGCHAVIHALPDESRRIDLEALTL